MGEVGADVKTDVTEYEVKAGDNLTSIAQNFGISISTITSANNLTSSSKLKVGQKLVILPVSGVLHYVKAGDTITGIAARPSAETIGQIKNQSILISFTIFRVI